jgi:hypothetical protein
MCALATNQERGRAPAQKVAMIKRPSETAPYAAGDEVSRRMNQRRGADRMVFQVASKVFQKEFPKCHRGKFIPKGVSDFLHFAEGDALSGNVAVENRLVPRVAALYNDVVHLFRKRGVAKQQENEVV